MDSEKYITFNELLKLYEKVELSEDFFGYADLLVSAITDWPDEIELSGIILNLKDEIKDNLTRENINKYLKTLNPEKDAWKMESLTSLLNLFDLLKNKDIELETIFEQITRYYRN